MINKKHITIIIGILLIIANSYIVQASLNKTLKSIDLKDVEDLLNKRTKVMNEGLYNSTDISKIIEELKTIEKDELLNSDINMLKEIKLSPTDIPVANRLSIKEIKNLHETEKGLKMTALVKWHVSYFTEEKYEECVYNIEIVKSDNNIYLSKFNPVK